MDMHKQFDERGTRLNGGVRPAFNSCNGDWARVLLALD